MLRALELSPASGPVAAPDGKRLQPPVAVFGEVHVTQQLRGPRRCHQIEPGVSSASMRRASVAVFAITDSTGPTSHCTRST